MKEKAATLEFLGTGGSVGVPVIGCSCEVCRSTDPHNQRLRTSALLNIEGKRILIDSGPDYRQQALRSHIDHLDGVIFTHAHQDHTGGIDELRMYLVRGTTPMPALLSKETYEDLYRRFHYIFVKEGYYDALNAKFQLIFMDEVSGQIEFMGIPLSYFTYKQAGMKVNGIRIGNMAYVTDIKNYDDSIFEHLKGVDQLVVSALRYTPSPLHFTVDEAVDFSKKVGAKHAWLTHLSHDLDHERTNAYLPENVRLAYDGLIIPFSV